MNKGRKEGRMKGRGEITFKKGGEKELQKKKKEERVADRIGRKDGTGGENVGKPRKLCGKDGRREIE